MWSRARCGIHATCHMRWRLLQSDWLCQDSGRANRNLARVPRPFLLFPLPFRPPTNRRAPWRVWLRETNLTPGLIGFGKSSAVLIISPLVSLMVDQVQKFRSRDTKTFISSSCTRIVGMAQELLATDSSLQHNRLFFCAPKSLMKGKWREALENPLVSVCH